MCATHRRLDGDGVPPSTSAILFFISSFECVGLECCLLSKNGGT